MKLVCISLGDEIQNLSIQTSLAWQAVQRDGNILKLQEVLRNT